MHKMIEIVFYTANNFSGD